MGMVTPHRHIGMNNFFGFFFFLHSSVALESWLWEAGKLFDRIVFACKHYFVKNIYQCIYQLQGGKIIAEIFLKCLGVYFNIVISVFIFSHNILERVGQKSESKTQHLTSD